MTFLVWLCLTFLGTLIVSIPLTIYDNWKMKKHEKQIKEQEKEWPNDASYCSYTPELWK